MISLLLSFNFFISFYLFYFLKKNIINKATEKLNCQSTTGGVALKVEPSQHFGVEYSRLEEARAELFSLWGMSLLVRDGILTKDEQMAGYYTALTSMTRAIELPPVDHNGSWNMMFHYFLQHGGFEEIVEGGKVKFRVVPLRIPTVVESMLGEIGNIKATGDLERLATFKSLYLSTARQEEFKRRFENMPLGYGFYFPSIDSSGNLTYASEIMNQKGTLTQLNLLEA